ncbi:hypothetical protein [Dactylosporangium sp. NPDC005555]|uniref:hypothetical protein n=1 Tax=Dactylosporangium sp. NPDC005555 TaxID=3154889 RepID=UPI0033A22F37
MCGAIGCRAAARLALDDVDQAVEQQASGGGRGQRDGRLVSLPCPSHARSHGEQRHLMVRAGLRVERLTRARRW